MVCLVCFGFEKNDILTYDESLNWLQTSTLLHSAPNSANYKHVGAVFSAAVASAVLIYFVNRWNLCPLGRRLSAQAAYCHHVVVFARRQVDLGAPRKVAVAPPVVVHCLNVFWNFTEWNQFCQVVLVGKSFTVGPNVLVSADAANFGHQRAPGGFGKQLSQPLRQVRRLRLADLASQERLFHGRYRLSTFSDCQAHLHNWHVLHTLHALHVCHMLDDICVGKFNHSRRKRSISTDKTTKLGCFTNC